MDGKAARLRTPRALSSQGQLDVLGEYEFDIRYIMGIVRSLNRRHRLIFDQCSGSLRFGTGDEALRSLVAGLKLRLWYKRL